MKGNSLSRYASTGAHGHHVERLFSWQNLFFVQHQVVAFADYFNLAVNDLQR
jgi:hypothetical protein